MCDENRKYYDKMHEKFTGQSLDMNYRDFAKFIDGGRKDAYWGIHTEVHMSDVTFVASFSDEFHNVDETELFGLHLDEGTFWIDNIEAVGHLFGADRMKAVLQYLSLDKNVWLKSDCLRIVLVLAEDLKGNKCLLKHPKHKENDYAYNMSECEIAIVDKNADLQNLDDDYYFPNTYVYKSELENKDLVKIQEIKVLGGLNGAKN